MTIINSKDVSLINRKVKKFQNKEYSNYEPKTSYEVYNQVH